ncbi:hypothetical protein EYF80_060133 [Liparis tanakae]|uniref:Uncharacterized protein n=1 Tax=Liparis tanakae TaxID=230148 RepID=A0A4Z2ELP6_9TELE|nr:hypothetical protein EYF80_060133 [Liparis tanakae]
MDPAPMAKWDERDVWADLSDYLSMADRSVQPGWVIRSKVAHCPLAQMGGTQRHRKINGFIIPPFNGRSADRRSGRPPTDVLEDREATSKPPPPPEICGRRLARAFGAKLPP